MKINEYGKKTYFAGFGFVMLLNICLTVFLIKNVFPQTSDDKIKNQLPIVVETVPQNDSPLRITITNIDNSNKDYQEINYTVQNVSNKSVRAYVVLNNSKINGDRGTTIRRFGTTLFQPGEFDKGWLSEERNLIKSGDVLFLSIDYVEFEDDTFWGKDTAQQSEYLAGSRAGWKEAVKQSKLLYHQKGTALIDFLKREATEINPPSIDSNQTSKWQDGFRSGYRAAISTLQKTYKNQGIDLIHIKMSEMEKAID
ncbi:MAG: hypothetical protein M3384_14585 [Acidobacteriota bacterium]|nr:hypothetical protein [Acidobacteriota bacterium]